MASRTTATSAPRTFWCRVMAVKCCVSSPVRSRSSYKSTFITVLLSTLQQTKENAELLDQLPDRTRAEARFGLGGASQPEHKKSKSTTPRADAPPGVLVRPCNNYMPDIGPRLRELPRYRPRLWPDLRLIWAGACACCVMGKRCESGDVGLGGETSVVHFPGLVPKRNQILQP